MMSLLQYYETLLKSALLFGDQRYLQMWSALYNATDTALVRTCMQHGYVSAGRKRTTRSLLSVCCRDQKTAQALINGEREGDH